MNKPVHLVLSILEISKILMCKFWYDYVKTKYYEKVKFGFLSFAKKKKGVKILVKL